MDGADHALDKWPLLKLIDGFEEHHEMSQSGLTRRLAAIVSVLLIAAPAAIAAPLILITPDEAKLPMPKEGIPISSRGVTRGPQIEVVASATPTISPTHLQLKFVAHGGANVDP